MKHLGEKPPKCRGCPECGSTGCAKYPDGVGNAYHYYQSLIEAAEEMRNKNFTLTDRVALQDWANQFSEKLLISAGYSPEGITVKETRVKE